MPATQEYITPKQLICYLDRQAGQSPEDIAQKLCISQNTVNTYTTAVNNILRQNNQDLTKYRAMAFALVPAALKRLSQLIPKATTTDILRLLEGTQTLSKTLNIQHNIVSASLDELMAIVKQQAGSEAQYAEVIEVLDDNAQMATDAPETAQDARSNVGMGVGASNQTHGTNGQESEGSAPDHGEVPVYTKKNRPFSLAPENSAETVDNGTIEGATGSPDPPSPNPATSCTPPKVRPSSVDGTPVRLSPDEIVEKIAIAMEDNAAIPGMRLPQTTVESRPAKKYWRYHRYDVDGKWVMCEGSEWNEERGDWDYRFREIKRRGRRMRRGRYGRG